MDRGEMAGKMGKKKQTAQWTKKLIPKIKIWTDCKHRHKDYHLTQAFSGHGCFKAYTQKIGKTDANCHYCGILDTAEHTLFECDRWLEYRRRAEINVNGQITPDNMTDLMITSKENWNYIHDMIRQILGTKESDERKRSEN